MTTGVSEPQAAAPLKKNVFARFAGVLFAPADAFEEIVWRPDVLAPLLLMVIVSFASTIVLVPRLDTGTMKANQREQILKRSPGASEADLERFDRVTDASAKVLTWLSPV